MELTAPCAKRSTGAAARTFVLDLDAGELRTADGHLAELRRQALDVLLVLGVHAGHVVGKDDLMRHVWPRVVVGEDSLVQAIADIRRVLGDREHKLVRNVPRRGYMLVPGEGAALPMFGGGSAAESGATAAIASAKARADDPAAAPAASASTATPSAAVAALPTRWRWLTAGIVLLLAIAGQRGHRADAAAGPVDASAGARLPNRWIVILPFEDPGGSADDAWLVDAVTSDPDDQRGPEPRHARHRSRHRGGVQGQGGRSARRGARARRATTSCAARCVATASACGSTSRWSTASRVPSNGRSSSTWSVRGCGRRSATSAATRKDAVPRDVGVGRQTHREHGGPSRSRPTTWRCEATRST